MARFKFYLIGSCEAPIVDVDAADLAELNDAISCARFVQGHMAQPDADGVLPGVLVATNRIQLVCDAS